MELTGKCLESFYNYVIPEIRKMEGVGSRFFDETIIKEFQKWPETIKNSFIIEFFDSIGNIDIFNSKWSDTVWQWSIDDGFEYPDGFDLKSRSEAKNAAIIKANEIFNSRY